MHVYHTLPVSTVLAHHHFVLRMYNQTSWNNTLFSNCYQFGVTVPLLSPGFLVRFLPVPVPFFFDRTTFIGSGVPVRKSSAVM
jgi:hypothetical protein